MTEYRGLEAAALNSLVRDRLSPEQTASDFHLPDLTADLRDSTKAIYEAASQSASDLYDDLSHVQGQIEEQIRDTKPSVLKFDQTEGKAAPYLYETISAHQIPVPVLDDPRFWAYLSMAYLWNFAAWRQRSTFARLITPDSTDTILVDRDTDDEGGKSDFDNLLKYVDGSSQRDCIALRMYLRVHCLGGSEHRDLSSILVKSADLWKSHVLQVKQGMFPAAVRAMVRQQARARLSKDYLRAFASNLNHQLYNFELGFLSDDEQKELVETLWDEQLTLQGGPASI